MTSAREIAHGLGPAGGDGTCYVAHTSFCDSRTAAIQQAREDGARWLMEQAKAVSDRWPDPADVRKVAP